MVNYKKLLLVVLAAMVMVGCSDNDSSGVKSVRVFINAGQDNIQDALVRSSQVANTGLPNTDAEGRLVHDVVITDKNGEAKAAVYTGNIQLFQLVARQANSDRNQTATSTRCQWVAGCANNVAFGGTIYPAAYEWRSVVYGLNRNDRIRVTPFTELAAALAFAYVYAEEAAPAAEWQATGYYSLYSIVQANSQVSKLFGIQDVQTSKPLDLTKINDAGRSNSTEGKDRIRYGALVAAWAHLQESDAEFARAAVEEFLTNKGQVQKLSSASVFSLQTVLTKTKENLQGLTVTNSTAKGYVDAVIADLDNQIATLTVDELTDTQPAPLKDLIGDNAYGDFNLGVARTKAFMAQFRDLGNTFFEEGYKAQLDAYADNLKALGDAHKANLNSIIKMLQETQELYAQALVGGADCGVTSWSAACAFNTSTKVMTIGSGADAITVSQRLANLSPTNTETPTQSQAVDVLMKGVFKAGDLKLVARHKYKNDKEADGIASPSGVRVYFKTPQEQYPIASTTILAYELLLADFELYDATAVGQANELELSGSFRILLRGVANPADENDIRFNIDSLTLNSRISDVINDSETNKDTEFTSVYLASRSTNAAKYFPDERMAGFDGFFTPKSDYVFDSVASNLAGYKVGRENLGGQDVEYFDFYNNVDESASSRYRFYPTIKRKDVLDVDKDGDVTEMISTHDMAICPLKKVGAEWVLDSGRSCSPKQRLYVERNLQKAINDLWAAGVFSRVEVANKGEYFIQWPATEANGCYQLNDLGAGNASMSGKLKKPMVLGLDTVRSTTIVSLKKASATDRQKLTALDVLIHAPTLERYSVEAGLSHDYSALSNNKIFLGTGPNLDRIILNFNTDSNFKSFGDINIYKAGVKLEMGNNTTTTINGEILSGFQYLYPSDALNPLPYKYVTDKNGNYEICVTDNSGNWKPTVLDPANIDDATIMTLNFRGVVYGSIRNENGAWVTRYVDGTFDIF